MRITKLKSFIILRGFRICNLFCCNVIWRGWVKSNPALSILFENKAYFTTCWLNMKRKVRLYRGSRTRRYVEQRNSIFGTLWNHVVLRNRIKWLEVNQHLISLIDTGKTESMRLVEIQSSLQLNLSIYILVFFSRQTLHLCSVFQKRRMTDVRYGLVMGFLWVQLMSCKMS